MKNKENNNAWENLGWIWHLLFAASLLASVLVSYAAAVPLGGMEILLSLLIAVWHWGGLAMAERFSPVRDQDRWRRFLVLAGDILIWFLLLQRNAAFYVLLLGIYGNIFLNLRIAQAGLAAAAIAVSILLRETIGRGRVLEAGDPLVWMLLLSSIGGIALAVFISAIIRESRKRSELIAQLEAAQSSLREAVHREAVLKERQRLARDIHDTLAQGFTGIVIHLQAASLEIEKHAPRPGHAAVQKALETARRNLDEARRVVRDLRPESLEDTSLAQALVRMTAGWGQEQGIPVDLVLDAQVTNPGGDREVCLYRAAEQALANIARHAGAGRVSLRLSAGKDGVRLDVEDDGLGMDASARIPADRFGIRGMRERAEALGGELEVSARIGGGTRISVILPLEEGEA